jgi:hypothetical protein
MSPTFLSFPALSKKQLKNLVFHVDPIKPRQAPDVKTPTLVDLGEMPRKEIL